MAGNLIYNSFKRDIFNGSIDLDTDTIKVMLVNNAYGELVIDTVRDTHTKRSDVTAFEVAGTGYTAGGATLAGKAVTVDNTDNEGVFDADDVVWTGVITARGMVMYKSRGGADTADELIGFWDFTTERTSAGGAFTISFNAEGILNAN